MAKLSAEQISDLKKLFDKYDQDKSGDITVAELKQFFIKSGFPLTPLELADLMGRADRDKSGTIDFEEFCVLNTPPKFDEEQFKKYDKNGDGFIGPEEVAELAKDIGHKDVTPQTAKLVMDQLDKNKDGKISLEEFKTLNTK